MATEQLSLYTIATAVEVARAESTADGGPPGMSDDLLRRAENQQLYHRMISAQNAKDRDGFLACFDDDSLFEAP
ncbi:hypothetical protein, partial [Nocardia sp.]|uniref:hypothetical protein n=1 Tax=Nocardia sp. TaxID=1821 RepID=UPI0026031D14